MKKRITACIMIIAMLLSVLPAGTLAANRYGNMPIYLGYYDVDYMADEILKEIPTAGKSPVEKIRAVYDWIITHCTRYENEWDGVYHFSDEAIEAVKDSYIEKLNSEIYSGRSVIREDLEAHFGMPSFFSVDSQYSVAAYAYDIMMTRNGNCLHYAALLTVLLGHLGFDSRIIDGYFKNADGSMPVHKWNYVLVDGQYYWLDVRMDHANYKRTGKINYQYFMISDTAKWERNHQWDHQYSDILRQNAGAVAALYNETALKYENAKLVTVHASRSGGGDSDSQKFLVGDTAEITADHISDVPFVGWYDEWGNLVTTDYTYSFTVQNNTTLYALYEGDVFADIPANSWYLNAAMEAYERGLVNGTTAVTFDGKGKFTRAMVATILARITGDDITASPKSPFTDVPDGSWYAGAVNWAYENGIVLGRTETEFAPKDQVTRQEFLTMTVRFLKAKGYETEPAELNYTDAADISAYAREPICTAQAMGLVSGYPDGTILPKGVLNRAEGTTIVLRAADYIEKNKPVQDTDNPADTDDLNGDAVNSAE